MRSDQGRGNAGGIKGAVLKALSLWSLCDENNLPSDIAGAPFSNITDRNGNVIPGTGSHGIFPYARTSRFGFKGGAATSDQASACSPLRATKSRDSWFVRPAASGLWLGVWVNAVIRDVYREEAEVRQPPGISFLSEPSHFRWFFPKPESPPFKFSRDTAFYVKARSQSAFSNCGIVNLIG